ncbi:DUF2225 domain-containing protein [Heliobacterium gestii]|uniref:DUF2225 domain-containing protein n=1 Tax=Heliomicrobium gestii TaxID=2699 RepID=A0A845LGX6_HELGE|nr:DUF2225 domain-containing protein [Heliomicrobium gestii]MBM7867284.1 uncharacterized protein (DUF2225 family) [Heliomicrobium gestii]MZP43839.1 DUF2225 domain-containing protein [Heliomicrobium gestii]
MNADAFFTQRKTCPVCGHEFVATRIRSSFIRVKERMPDFRTIFEGINPLHYQVFVCPACQYAALENRFDQVGNDRLQLRRGLLDAFSAEPDFSGTRTAETALRSFELALRTAQIGGAPASLQAPLNLRAAWIAREMRWDDVDRKYTEAALRLYEAAFGDDRNAKTSAVTLMYLIGELHRQLGQQADAVRWLARAAMHPDVKKEPEIERLVRQQWSRAREENKAGDHEIRTDPAENGAMIASIDGDAAEPAPDQPAASPQQNVDFSSRKRLGPKIRFTVTLYEDEIDWLKRLSSVPYAESKLFMDKESVLRALLDAAMETWPEVRGFSDEAGLRQKFIEAMQTKKPGS